MDAIVRGSEHGLLSHDHRVHVTQLVSDMRKFCAARITAHTAPTEHAPDRCG